MVSIDALKAALRITGGRQNARLKILEAAAAKHVQRTTNRFFGAEEVVTRYVTGNGGPNLWLPDDAKAGETITISERAVPGGAATVITEGDDDGWLERVSHLDSTRVAKLVRKNGHVWGLGYELEVQYTRGYAAASTGDPTQVAAPEEIQEAVIQLATHWHENALPVVTGTIATKVPLHVEATLARWRRRPWG